MKKTVRILTFMLAVLMLVACFAACNKNKGGHKTPAPTDEEQTNNNPSNTGTGNGGEEETTPGEDPVIMPDKIDLEGYTYRAYVRSNVATGTPVEDGNPAFYCTDFWVNPNDDNTADAIAYAVYTRNKELEADYNVKIRQENQTINMAQELGRFFQNGTTFELTVILAKSAANAAIQNLLTNLKGQELTGLDLTHEAYDQNSIRELSIAGNLYYLGGDMNNSTLDSIAPTVVNMELYEDYAEGIVKHFDNNTLYSNVYNLVTSNKWTIETMLEIAQITSLDADTSDGNLGASDQDRVGYFQYNESAVYYFYGAGGRITKINEDGVPAFVIKDQQNQDLFDYLFDNLHPSVRNTKYPNGYSGDRKTNFMGNANTLFTDMSLWDVRTDLYLNAGFRYGLLPNPVYEEGDSYNAVVYFYNIVHLWAIPSLCEDIDKAQVMMNAMAAYSALRRKDSTMDAYYTRTLYFSVAPDPEARKVMDIIKNSTVYDIALLYDWGGWRTELSELWYKRTTNNYGSLAALVETNAQPKLEETIEQFKNPGTLVN